MVTLGSVRERNDCLSASFNLDKHISIDKYVPKRFEAKYNEFKEIAWKIRSSQKLNTWVGFDGHKLVIKQKKKDEGSTKFGWEEFDFWIPSINDPLPAPKGVNVRQNTVPSPPLSKETLRKMIFATKVKSELTGQQLIDKLNAEFIQPEDKDIIDHIEFVKKGMIIFHLTSDAHAEPFVAKYKDIDFCSAKVSISKS